MASSSAGQRRGPFAVPASQSKTGKPAYPIGTRAKAANAKSRVAANGTPQEKALVKKAVSRKYPDMGKS